MVYYFGVLIELIGKILLTGFFGFILWPITVFLIAEIGEEMGLGSFENIFTLLGEHMAAIGITTGVGGVIFFYAGLLLQGEDLP